MVVALIIVLGKNKFKASNLKLSHLGQTSKRGSKNMQLNAIQFLRKIKIKKIEKHDLKKLQQTSPYYKHMETKELLLMSFNNQYPINCGDTTIFKKMHEHN